MELQTEYQYIIQPGTRLYPYFPFEKALEFFIIGISCTSFFLELPLESKPPILLSGLERVTPNM